MSNGPKAEVWPSLPNQFQLFDWLRSCERGYRVKFLDGSSYYVPYVPDVWQFLEEPVRSRCQYVTKAHKAIVNRMCQAILSEAAKVCEAVRNRRTDWPGIYWVGSTVPDLTGNNNHGNTSHSDVDFTVRDPDCFAEIPTIRGYVSNATDEPSWADDNMEDGRLLLPYSTMCLTSSSATETMLSNTNFGAFRLSYVERHKSPDRSRGRIGSAYLCLPVKRTLETIHPPIVEFGKSDLGKTGGFLPPLCYDPTCRRIGVLGKNNIAYILYADEFEKTPAAFLEDDPQVWITMCARVFKKWNDPEMRQLFMDMKMPRGIPFDRLFPDSYRFLYGMKPILDEVDKNGVLMSAYANPESREKFKAFLAITWPCLYQLIDQTDKAWENMLILATNNQNIEFLSTAISWISTRNSDVMSFSVRGRPWSIRYSYGVTGLIAKLYSYEANKKAAKNIPWINDPNSIDSESGTVQ
jgi:hypothetical protein